MKCKNCMFWQRDGADGICRRYAPKPVIAIESSYLLILPRTKSDDWCGDFKQLEIGDETKHSYT